jgi:hypothetical protein
MENFIIIITYTDGQVEKQHLCGTIEQASKAMDIYKRFSEVKSVVLQYE